MVMATKKKATKKKAKKKKTTKKKATVKKKVGDRLGGKKSKAVVRSEEEKQNEMYGNSFWMKRSTHGRKPIFGTPEDLFDACLQYFKYVEESPLQEEKAFAYKGFVTKENVSKMRAMTIMGLTIFLGISEDAWSLYRKREGFIGVCKEVENIIYQQKLTGASADLLNASIIARHLGLKDHQDISSKDGSMTPSQTSGLTNEELEKELKKYGIKRKSS